MKKYTLWIVAGSTSHQETITAATHTIENGVYIFWVTNQAGEWAQICCYPTTCTAITRIQDLTEPILAIPVAADSNVRTNKTVDIEEVLPKPEASKTPKGRKK